jgi:hypothetical protein
MSVLQQVIGEGLKWYAQWVGETATQPSLLQLLQLLPPLVHLLQRSLT